MNEIEQQFTYFRVGSASDAFINTFLQRGKILFFYKNDIIYSDREKVDGIFLVLDGIIECYYVENEKKRVFAYMGEKTLLGMIGTISQRHTSTRCYTDCVVAFLEKTQLYQMDRMFLVELLNLQVEKAHWFIHTENKIALDNIKMRLLRFLYEASHMNLTMNREDLPTKLCYSRQEIACVISTSREYVTSLLKEIQKEVRMQVNRNEIILYPCDISRAISKTKKM